MSEQKNQQKQPPKRATSGIFAILMALLLLILGQQGILPLGDTAGTLLGTPGRPQPSPRR